MKNQVNAYMGREGLASAFVRILRTSCPPLKLTTSADKRYPAPRCARIASIVMMVTETTEDPRYELQGDRSGR